MIKFSKEEISLCKQVVEKYGKEINIGKVVVYGGNPCIILFTIGKDKHVFEAGKTPLEACLKAVLAVLEEGK